MQHIGKSNNFSKDFFMQKYLGKLFSIIIVFCQVRMIIGLRWFYIVNSLTLVNQEAENDEGKVVKKIF